MAKEVCLYSPLSAFRREEVKPRGTSALEGLEPKWLPLSLSLSRSLLLKLALTLSERCSQWHAQKLKQLLTKDDKHSDKEASLVESQALMLWIANLIVLEKQRVQPLLGLTLSVFLLHQQRWPHRSEVSKHSDKAR